MGFNSLGSELKKLWLPGYPEKVGCELLESISLHLTGVKSILELERSTRTLPLSLGHFLVTILLN